MRVKLRTKTYIWVLALLQGASLSDRVMMVTCTSTHPLTKCACCARRFHHLNPHFVSAGILLLLLNSVTAEAPSAVAHAAHPGAAAAAHPQAQPIALPDSDLQGDGSASSSIVLLDESGQQILEESLSVDVVAAEAAARPAAQEPSQYAVKGVIDPQSALFSGASRVDE